MHLLRLGLFFRYTVVPFVSLHQVCRAFVPPTTWVPRCGVQQHASSSALATQRSQPHLRISPPSAETATVGTRAAVVPHRRRTTVSAGRRELAALCSSSGVGHEGVEVAVDSTSAVTAAPTDDEPFRPERASVSPLVINALLPILFVEVSAKCDVMRSVCED